MTAEVLCNGIVERILGKEYGQWFEFQTVPMESDGYRLRTENGKVLIQGRNGVSMAAGLKHYLKRYCRVYIGQQTVQKRMPQTPVLLDKPVEKKACSQIRYAYNYCTLSYSMPFWDEKRWQRELDWLALSGVNLVLDFTGIEEVWNRFLKELGYSQDEIQQWIVGPCYTAWQQMQNIESFGGPVPPAYFKDRAALARRNQQWMKTMGMKPVRQGYGGMVPSWHEKHDKSAKVFHQGQWNGLTRPAMLDPTSDTFRKYAALFYKIQDEVLGEGSHYYAADVFHEGGIRPEGLTDDRISESVLRTMMTHDKEAVWLIQAWRENPTDGLLNGIQRVGKDHALILDLSATDNPQWKKSQFFGIPWVYCMLDMYGGRVSTHGEPEVLAKDIPQAREQSVNMAGIGFTSEATLHNPIVFDLLLDMAWEESADLEEWVKEWLTARYGVESEKAFQAWKGLLQTAYHSPGYSHHGGYTQIFTFRPHPDMAYGEVFNELNSTIIKKPYYDTLEFEKAVFLLAEEMDSLKEEETWIYDMQDFLRQVLNNRAAVLALDGKLAWEQKDERRFLSRREDFFRLLDACDRLMSIREDTTLGWWLGYAKKAGTPYGKDTEKLFVQDAKRLITTWAGEKTYESLADYAYRQYEGLLRLYYRPRWERFFRTMQEVPVKEWYNMAEDFILSDYQEKEQTDSAPQVIEDTLNLLHQMEG